MSSPPTDSDLPGRGGTPITRRLVAIVGATATGKTDLGEAIAEAVGGEVVCADARQVFAELEIGTGKPTPAQRAARPHHLFDALSLGQRASAGHWARLAGGTCETLFARGVTPVLVGGSGLYVSALLHGLHAEPPHDPAVRARLAEERRALGPEALHARLARLDPETAARLAPRDGQRITRALEVVESSGHTLAWWHARPTRDAFRADARVLEVTWPPRELAERITRRTGTLFASGLVEETRALLERGHRDALVALRAIGYDEAMALLDGILDPEAARERTSLRTRQLAKRQRTWFRHQVDAARLDARACTAAEALLQARRLLGL